MKRPDGIILSISGSKLTNEEKSFLKKLILSVLYCLEGIFEIGIN